MDPPAGVDPYEWAAVLRAVSITTAVMYVIIEMIEVCLLGIRVTETYRIHTVSQNIVLKPVYTSDKLFVNASILYKNPEMI